jgi:hypothetical protein
MKLTRLAAEEARFSFCIAWWLRARNEVPNLPQQNHENQCLYKEKEQK